MEALQLLGVSVGLPFGSLPRLLPLGRFDSDGVP